MDNCSRNIRPSIKPNEISSKKNYLISALKSFEATINDKKKKYFDKVQWLAVAWDQLAVFISLPSSESPITEVESLILHTLRFVLRADWPRVSAATQTHLTVTLQRFVTVLSHSKRYPYILQQCRVLESVVKNPWSHPVLSRIFADEEIDIDDLLEYFEYENGKIIVVRLEMMLEAQCEDMALRLSKSCLLTYYNSHPLELDFNQDEVDYITDIYFCSLYRDKKKKELTNEIKLYELDDGLQLLKRYNKNGGVGRKFNDNCKDARVWKCSDKVMELVANTLLANSVLHDDLVDSDTILPDLIAEWAAMQKPEDCVDVSPISLEIIRKLVISAGSSKCIYPFCSFLIENCACRERYLNLVAKCLIRAINQNMNEIESYRVHRDYENLKTTYEQLSQGFVLISKLFGDQSNICRECLLTSFSLTPSREGLGELETFIDMLINEENSAAAINVNDQNALGSPRSTAEREQNVPSCTENVVDDHSVPSCPKGTENDQCVPSSPHNATENTQIAPNSPNKAVDLNVRSSPNSPKKVELEVISAPNSPKETAELEVKSTSNSPKEDVELEIISAPNSPEKIVNPEASERNSVLCNGEHDELGEKTVPEPVPPNNEAAIVVEAVPPTETDVGPASPKSNETETEVVSHEGGLLSMATDTKLKSAGAVEELVKGAAPAYCAEVENLKLDESIKVDLSSILRYQRFRSLSWELEWGELKNNCENFLEIFEQRGFEDVELKYLDIDYSQFKDQPINEDDYIGIEKGYEHFALPDPAVEESDHERSSSGDTDDDYMLQRRKKILRRNRLKKAKAKLKTFYDGSSEEFVNSPGNMIVKKKRKLSVDSADGEFKMRKKRMKRPKISGETDVAIDSQSENYPPDFVADSFSANEVVDESQGTNNVQLLRQYRIGMKTSGGGELSEITCNDAKLNHVKQTKSMKILLPKCDDEGETDKLIKPRMSVTLPVPGKRSTMQAKPKRVRRPSDADSLFDFEADLEIQLSLNELDADMFTTQQLDDELRSMMEFLDPDYVEEADTLTTETCTSEPTLVEEPALKTEPIEEVETYEPASTPSIPPLVIKKKIRMRVKKEGVERKTKKPRGRPKKGSDCSEMNSPSASQLVPCSSSTLPYPAAASESDLTINSYLAGSYLQPTPYTPMSSENSALSLPAASYSDASVSGFPNNTSESWDPNYTPLSYTNAPPTTSPVYTDLNAASSATVMPAYSQTSVINSVPTPCSVYAPLDEAPPGSTASPLNFVRSEENSTACLHSSAVAPPASNYTRSLMAAQTTSPVYTNLDAIPSSGVAHALSYPQTELSATNASEPLPSLFTNGVVNAPQTICPPALHFSQSSTAVEDQLPSLQIPSSENGIEPAQTMDGAYSELVNKLPDAPNVPEFREQSHDGVKRPRKKKKVAFADETEMPDGQSPKKVKRPRKPKNDVMAPDQQALTETNQPQIGGELMKVKRRRQPKKSKTLDDQSSTASVPAMSSLASAVSPSSPFGDQPSAFALHLDHELSSIYAVSDLSYQPSLDVVPDTTRASVDGQKIKIKKPRKSKSDASSSDQRLASTQKKRKKESDHHVDYLQPSPLSSSNYETSSVSAFAHSNPQPQFVPTTSDSFYHPSSTVSDSNGRLSSVCFNVDQSYLASSLVDQRPAVGEVKPKRARKPKIDAALSDDQSSTSKGRKSRPRKLKPEMAILDDITATFSTPAPVTSCSSTLWNADANSQSSSLVSVPISPISLSDPRTASEKIKIQRSRKPKKEITPSYNLSSTSSEEAQPVKRGRKRKPTPETALDDHRLSTSVLPVSAFTNPNWSQPPSASVSNPSPSSVLSVDDSNYQSSSEVSSSAISVGTNPESGLPVKVKRVRKPKNISLLDSQFSTCADKRKKEMTTDGSRIEIEYTNESTTTNRQLSTSAVEVEHQFSPNSILEVKHESSPVSEGLVIENGVENKVAPVKITADKRYPVVLIPEIRIPPLRVPPLKLSSFKLPTNSAKRHSKPKKKETESVETRVVHNGRGHSQYVLPPVEVRVPPLPLSHLQQYEVRQENDTPQASSSAGSFRNAVNGTRRPRKTKPPSSLFEFATDFSVELMSSNSLSDGTPPVNQVSEPQQSPTFNVPSKSYLKTYLTGGGKLGVDAPAPFINASTPKTLAEGYSVIAVPDLNSVTDLRTSPGPDPVSHQDRFADQLHKEEEQYAQVYDHHRGSVNVPNGNAMSTQQYVSDNHSPGSSHNSSSPPMNVSSTVGVTNVKVEQYIVDDTDNDSAGPCIRIPENAMPMGSFEDSYLTLGNYLPLIKNTNPIPSSEQTISSNNDFADLIRQCFPDQMTTYGSL